MTMVAHCFIWNGENQTQPARLSRALRFGFFIFLGVSFRSFTEKAGAALNHPGCVHFIDLNNLFNT
jgi:hypothetical protein